MPSSYTPSLKLVLQATGENNGSWGTITNSDFTSLVDVAVAGYIDVTMADATKTLDNGNGAAPNQARYAYINVLSSVALTAVQDVIVPDASKIYHIKNSTTGGWSINVKTSAGTGVAVPPGEAMLLVCNGTTGVVTAITAVYSLGIYGSVHSPGLNKDIDSEAYGTGALGSTTTGFSNTALGVNALTANTIGNNNTAVGLNAMLLNTDGNVNIAIGENALKNNLVGSSNVAIGFNTLFANTSNNNTAVGSNAMRQNTTGTLNVAVGFNASNLNLVGVRNTAVGYQALQANLASYNTAVGYQALLNNTSGLGNTAINPLTSAGTYAPVFNPTVETNRFCMGSTGVTNAYIQVAWTVVSDARDKTNFGAVPHGLAFVNKLSPVSFQFKESRDVNVPHGPVRYGFKAQDVLALEGASPVVVDAEDSEKLRFNESSLVPILVKAIQELSAKFDAYVAAHP